MTGLRPNTTYVITVSAVNVVGVGAAAKIRVTTAMPSEGQTQVTRLIDVTCKNAPVLHLRTDELHKLTGVKSR